MALTKNLIIVSEEDFARNFKGNKAYPTIEALQAELDRLVLAFNRGISSPQGLKSSETMKAGEELRLLTDKLFRE